MVPTWVNNCTFWVPGASQKPSWSILDHVGSISGHLGGVWRRLAGVLGRLESVLGTSWERLKPSWEHLGSSWSHLGAQVGFMLGHWCSRTHVETHLQHILVPNLVFEGKLGLPGTLRTPLITQNYLRGVKK